MTATDPRDRQTVRRLLATHLVSGFPGGESEPLTVGDVACRVRADYATGHVPLRPADAVLVKRLLTDETPLSGRMTPRTIREATAQAGVELSEHGWERFRRAASEMLMSRGGR